MRPYFVSIERTSVLKCGNYVAPASTHLLFFRGGGEVGIPQTVRSRPTAVGKTTNESCVCMFCLRCVFSGYFEYTQVWIRFGFINIVWRPALAFSDLGLTICNVGVNSRLFRCHMRSIYMIHICYMALASGVQRVI